MALHRGMHRYQCESVIDAPGFPRSASVQAQPREAYQPSERKTWLKAAEKRPAAKGKKKTTATARKETARKTAASKKTTGQKKTVNKKKPAPRSR
jgi:hypothetical protein